MSNEARRRRSRREKALREDLGHILLDSVSQGILAIGRDGQIRLVNPAAESLFGYRHDELLGRSIELLLPRRFAESHREHRRQYFARPRNRPMGLDMDLAGRRRDGSEFPVEVSLSHVEIDGAPFVLAFVSDVSERKRAEDHRRRLEALVENSADFIALATVTGELTYVNGPGLDLLGWSELPWWKTNLADCVCEERPNELQTVVLPTVLQNGRWRGERSFRNVETGELTPMDMLVLAISSPKHAGPAHIGIEARSLAEREAAEEERRKLESQLAQATKMEAVGRLAGGIAHDFNNLITAMSGFSEILLDYLEEDHPLRVGAEQNFRTCQRSVGMIRQLLAVSRRQMLQPMVLNLNQQIAELGKMLQGLLPEDIRFRTELDPSLGHVRADPAQIEQVLLNLVVNARDAMPTGGELVLKTQNVSLDEASAKRNPGALAIGPHAMISVRDTGHGMEEDTLSHIFEPFFSTKSDRGTGLGLATVYGIVRQSGGNIWVQSEPGRGTIFQICFPRVEPSGEPVTPTGRGGRVESGVETVLVVEDASVVRFVVREALRKAGYRVLEARNGEQALRIVERHDSPIHLLITDVVMPGMNGPELASRIASLHPQLRRLYMSGHAEDAVVHHGVDFEGTEFLEKPFTREMLTSKVRELLDG